MGLYNLHSLVQAANSIMKLILLAAASQALELTSADYDEKTAGKSVFIKFLAPW